MNRLVVVTAAVLAALTAAVIAVLVAGRDGPASDTAGTTPGGSPSGTPLVRADSHRLDVAEDGKVVLVEFLDFECEACRAAYPLVEQVRKDYAGRITFVVRYFPIPSHRNSMTAAVAVEAAAQQGKMDAMYSKMYQTQSQWGEQQASQAALFRTFAQQLGLDMATFDAAVADPATQRRVEQDYTDGLALGVEGTPTFFLNGTKMQISNGADFRAQIDAAAT